MGKFFKEFGEFIQRGNAMDMAVGVIIGGAFTAIVTSLTDNIIDPLLKLVTGGTSDIPGMTIPVGNTGLYVDFGAFISAIINFFIIAFVVFLMVKALNSFMKKQAELRKELKGEEDSVEMVPPTCPFCLEEVKEGATRCPHCAGMFTEPAKPTPKA